MRVLLLFVMLSPSLSQAALVKPDSKEGKQIVQRLADQISNSFVRQSEMIQKSESEPEEISESCSRDRESLLSGLSRLDLSRGGDLLAAKRALEKANCGANSPGEIDLKQANDSFFAATVYLRSIDGLN